MGRGQSWTYIIFTLDDIAHGYSLVPQGLPPGLIVPGVVYNCIGDIMSLAINLGGTDPTPPHCGGGGGCWSGCLVWGGGSRAFGVG